MYLVRLMSSWAIVCDVWFLEPQKQLPGESAIEFTERVKLMICNKAKITPVPWDGYYKCVRTLLYT
jgi:glycerol-3-phosphate O-acyltransferase 3/4